jgi:hypothetical protein
MTRTPCDDDHILHETAPSSAPLQFEPHRPGKGTDDITASGNKLNQADVVDRAPERRNTNDRRKRTFRSLVHGSLAPRRHGPRRGEDRSFTAVDWHHPQWLAVAILTLLLSSADAFLTLVLLERGANEANPFMEPLVGGSTLIFTMVKMGLTSGGIIVLILLARVRVFGRVPVSFLLYAVLLGYTVLVGYEFWLLEHLLLEP